MNQQVRELLIKHAIGNRPITYGAIMKVMKLDHRNEDHRNQLKDVLAEISTFEHTNGRPMVSALAMYDNLTEHGQGFYELAAKLGFGKQKELSDQMFGIEQLRASVVFWQNEENQKKFLLISDVAAPMHNFDFFTSDEIKFLEQWGGKVYEKGNDKHIAAKNYIINTLGTKTVYWSNSLVKLLPEYDTFNWRMWSQKGWEETQTGKARVARFKHYTWARIYKKGDDYKDIFFTVGVDGPRNELVYKLDYYFEKNSELNARQKEIVEQNIPAFLRWRAIKLENLADYNWDILIREVADFIAENTHVYDRLIEMAWNGKEPDAAFQNALRKQPFPAEGFTSLPTLNPTFTAVDKDFIQEAIENKEIGDAGEELVKSYEKYYLNSLGLHSFADEVDIVKPGLGYDVFSRFPDGKPKFIEVKTTLGKANAPFGYTINEYLFAERNTDSYFVYRLYNFDEDNNTADFFIISDALENILLQPVSYMAYPKKVGQSE